MSSNDLKFHPCIGAGPLYCNRLPHLSDPVFEYSLVYPTKPSSNLANILHGCWHPTESPDNPSIWMPLQTTRGVGFSPFRVTPSSTVHLTHWSPCCLQRHCLVILISKGQSTFHVKENVCLINVYHKLLAVMTLGKLAVDVGHKVLHCCLTLVGVLCYIGDKAVNNIHTCKPARDMLTEDKQLFWCIRYPLQFHSEYHHINMPLSIVQGVKHKANCSI